MFGFILVREFGTRRFKNLDRRVLRLSHESNEACFWKTTSDGENDNGYNNSRLFMRTKRFVFIMQRSIAISQNVKVVSV